MNPFLIKQAVILDRQSPWHCTAADLLISNGRYERIATQINIPNVQTFDGRGTFISPGWMDTLAYVFEPSPDPCESTAAALEAAASGGFTAIAACALSHPPADNEATVQFLISKASEHVVDLLPIGTFTNGKQGQQLAEMMSLHQAGAVAFSDAPGSVSSAGMMLLGMEYLRPIGKPVVSIAHEPSLVRHGQVHDGWVGFQLGLPGIPPVAETCMVARDIELAAYSGTPVHFSCITTRGSVQLIRSAKQRGIPVTASVSSMHLVLDETAVDGYDTAAKLFPPLRTQDDIEALKQGLADGTLDTLCSAHWPQRAHDKQIEFSNAAPGAINLQTSFALAWQALEGILTLEQFVELIAVRSRAVFRLPVPAIVEGAEANFTIFDPQRPWRLDASTNRSQTCNTPVWGASLKGKALAIGNKNHLKLLHS